MDRQKCVGHRPDGARCKRWPVRGATVCTSHGGASPQVQSNALVRTELAKWGLGDSTIDPGELLLRLTAQAAARVQFLSGLLEQQYALADAGEDSTTLPTRIAVLVGSSYALNREGHPVPIAEAVRALVQLEGVERDRAASFAAKAVAAGLETRMVEQAERVGAMLASMLQQVMDDPQLDLSDAQRGALPGAIRTALALVPGAG
jgi:hypothetical protein